MRSKATDVNEYVDELPNERKDAINQLRNIFKNNLPPGFEETMSCGMIGYVVPLSIYPNGYHCTPGQPLPFINIASQKNFIAIYHMGLYSNKKLLDWFLSEYPKHSKSKLDMGKSCIRFKKMEDIPYDLIAKLAQKVTLLQWIKGYEAAFKS